MTTAANGSGRSWRDPTPWAGRADTCGAGRSATRGRSPRSAHGDREQRQLGVVHLDLVHARLGALEHDRGRHAGLDVLSTSNPWACSWSSWSLVTVSVSVSPDRRSTVAGAGVTCLPVTVMASVRPVAVPLAAAAVGDVDAGRRTRAGAGGVPLASRPAGPVDARRTAATSHGEPTRR